MERNPLGDGLPDWLSEGVYTAEAPQEFTTVEGLAGIYTADAIAAADGKYDGLCFAGFDSGNKVHEWIMSDSKAKFICEVSQNPYLIRLGKGEAVDEHTVVPGVIFTRENYDELAEKLMVN